MFRLKFLPATIDRARHGCLVANLVNIGADVSGDRQNGAVLPCHAVGREGYTPGC